VRKFVRTIAPPITRWRNLFTLQGKQREGSLTKLKSAAPGGSCSLIALNNTLPGTAWS